MAWTEERKNKQREVMKKVREQYYSDPNNTKKWHEKICATNKIEGMKRVGRKLPQCGHVPWNKGLTNETDDKTRQISLKRSRPRSEQGRLSIKEASVKRSQDPMWQENMRRANKLIGISKRGIPRPPEVMAKILKVNKPTDIERKFIELAKKYSLPYRYVGDGQLWISNMNPDFINTNGKKQVIEVNGDFWHKGQNPQDRINRFKQYGFDCIVIWGKEMKGENWESNVLGRLI